MTHRGPRSVPLLMFGFLLSIDVSVWFPGTALVTEPLAGLALSAAVAAAARDAVTRRGAAVPEPSGVPDPSR